MNEMKKLISVIAIVAILTLSMLCVGAASAAQEPVSSEPAGDGDVNPDAPQYGPGPAPNYHDGVPDGPGW